jgi:hypothetical protein
MDAAAVDYAVREVPRGLVAAEGDEQAKTLEKSRSRLQSEIERLTEAIARSGGSEALPGALRKKETEFNVLGQTIRSMAAINIPVDLKWLRNQIEHSIETLPALLQLDPERARRQLQKHVKEIRMYPTFEDGKKFYVAEGEWFMPENNDATGPWINGGANMLRMVAGVGFEPTTFGL